jgi:hypothetical protein
MSKFNGSVILGLYEQAMEPARARLKTRVFGLLESNKDPQFWHKFLIAYCAQGVHMTKDVPIYENFDYGHLQTLTSQGHEVSTGTHETFTNSFVY